MSEKNLLEDDDADILIHEGEYYAPDSRRTPRWIPGVVMLAAVGGFVTLAWYAYTAGTHSVQEEELVLVEADKTPMKEAPADPGGMKFPHQDKTIFDTVSGTQAPQPVERVLPAPEEPVNKEQAEAAPAWVNSKLQEESANATGGTEILVEKPTDKPTDAPATQEIKPVEVAEAAAPAPEVAPVEPVAAAPAPVVESKPVELVSPAIMPQVKKEEPAKHVEKKAEAPKKAAAKAAAAKPAAGGATVVQLGAYRSEAEAHKAWSAIKAKHTALAGLEPSYVRADLGEKGVYYRLRLNVRNAADVCSQLSSKGQACIAVK